MHYNGANCDIYIGKGAGKKLLNDIRNARKSVKIVSPYLSPFLITQLINLRQRNLDVELITTDNIEDFNGNHEKNINKLILQNRDLDKVALEKREKWRRIVRILNYIGLWFVVVSTISAYYLQDIKVAYGVIPILLSLLIAEHFRRRIKNKRIYTYWYSQLFPFKVYMSPYSDTRSDTSIHSKIYLIDDEIAYLGSLNFTASGTKFNHETRIRTTDLKAVKDIQEEIYDLMHHSHLPEKDIQNWGRELYSEPIN